jgi:hypothetical protein
MLVANNVPLYRVFSLVEFLVVRAVITCYFLFCFIFLVFQIILFTPKWFLVGTTDNVDASIYMVRRLFLRYLFVYSYYEKPGSDSI